MRRPKLELCEFCGRPCLMAHLRPHARDDFGLTYICRTCDLEDGRDATAHYWAEQLGSPRPRATR